MYTSCTTEKTLYVRGFTLVEMLVVIAIIGIAIALPFMTLLDERKDTVLQSNQALVVQSLKIARSRAMAGTDAEDHGVHVDADKMVVFEGDTYNVGDPDNIEYPLSPNISASVTGSDTIIFSRLSGETTGETITLNMDGDTVNVTVNSYGLIE